VVFVPGVSEATVRRIMAERIVAAVSSVDARVTCSLGVATRDPGASFDVKTMLRAADAAMYSAKRSGGDRFVLAV
jgi:GGDEF domain-containing protein